MSKKEENQPSVFNADIYRWSLTIPVGKWYPIAPKSMTVEDFVNCIKYLIDCGEYLEFSEDYTAFRRVEDANYSYVS